MQTQALTDGIVTGLSLTNFLSPQGLKEELLPDHATWIHFFPTLPLLWELGGTEGILSLCIKLTRA